MSPLPVKAQIEAAADRCLKCPASRPPSSTRPSLACTRASPCLWCSTGSRSLEQHHQAGIATLGTVVLLLIRSISYGQQLQVGVNYLTEAVPYLRAIARPEDLYRRNRRQAGDRPPCARSTASSCPVSPTGTTGGGGPDGRQLRRREGRGRRARRPVGQRQVDADPGPAPPSGARGRPLPDQRHRTPRSSRSATGTGAWRSSRNSPTCSRPPWPTTSASSGITSNRRPSRTPLVAPTSTTRSSPSPMGTTRCCGASAAASRGPGATPVHRPGLGRTAGAPRPRRADECARRPLRGADPARPGRAPRRGDDGRDRPPPLHPAALQPDRRARSRDHPGRRHARTPRTGQRVLPVRRSAVTPGVIRPLTSMT